MPEAPDSRPRLGELLLSAGLISQEQIDENLTLARAAGKPLGHVLVERGLVPAHSIAMALADQHGGPLKTEFGFATGRGSTPGPAPRPAQAHGALPALRLAPAPLREEPPQPAEAVVRLDAEPPATELLARVAELQSELAAERAARAADATTRAADDAALAAVCAELAAARTAAEALRTRVTELEAATQEAETSAVAELQSELAAERAARAADAAARAADEVALAAVRQELAAARTAAEALRARVTELEAAARAAETSTVALDKIDELQAVIELQEQALASASAREHAGARSYSRDTHFLFAPGAGGYELLERSGPSPAPGEVVELSGGRTCRVLRIGPSPFPGATEACAYLEPV